MNANRREKHDRCTCRALQNRVRDRATKEQHVRHFTRHACHRRPKKALEADHAADHLLHRAHYDLQADLGSREPFVSSCALRQLDHNLSVVQVKCQFFPGSGHRHSQAALALNISQSTSTALDQGTGPHVRLVNARIVSTAARRPMAGYSRLRTAPPTSSSSLSVAIDLSSNWIRSLISPSHRTATNQRDPLTLP